MTDTYPCLMDPMPHGPVVSNTYNLVIDEIDKPFWSTYITPPLGNYELELTGANCPTSTLSRAEERLLTEIFDQYGHMNCWQLRDFTHTLPEWRDPGDSSLPISIREILQAQNVSREDIEAITQEIDAADFAESILGHVAVRLRLIHGVSGEFVSHFSECFLALAADHIGKIDCPCLGKLIERRGEAASIHHLQTNTTN